MPPARILVGVIGAPHGVRGEVRVKPFTDEPLALKTYGPLESEDGKRSLVVLSARLQGDMVVARFEGVADRDQAAALTKTLLYVPRDRLPAPDEGEYYHADLIGLRAEDGAGAELGTVTAVPNYGAGDLLEIAREGAGTFHIPFTDEFVPVVDIGGGRVVLALPDDFFEEAREENEEPAP